MSTTDIDVVSRELPVWDERITLRVKELGSGPPLVYLHPAGGLVLDPFLHELARGHTVFAPELPGTSAGDPNAIHVIDDFRDLVLVYEEAIRALSPDAPPILVGQSFGGMLALELAAQFPASVARVVVLDPVGLWLDEAPVQNVLAMAPEQLPAILFADPAGPAATAMFTLPDDPEAAVAAQAGLVWALGCAGKFIWPIPDHGLRDRLHRIAAPTLVVWGEEDRLVPVAHAHEFGRLIPGSRVELIPGCGHIPQMEAMDRTLELVRGFLGE